MRAALVALGSILLAGCTDWERFSKDYQGSGVCPTYVVAGDAHTCVRKSNGAAYCWGDNRFGELGTGDTKGRSAPARVNFAGLGTLKIYAPTGNGEISSDLTVFTCALASDNQFWCWGDNRYGQLGTGDTQSSTKPVLVKGLSTNVSKATNGAGHTCVMTTEGALYCWGRNVQGQLGTGDTKQQNQPVLINVGSAVERLSAGGGFTCARTTDAALYCWGDNSYGQLGVGTTDPHLLPTQVTTLANRVGRISTGGGHTCIFTQDDGQVWCWGKNNSGQLGTGDTDQRLIPVNIDAQGLGAVKINQVFAGGEHTCALRDDNTFWCWGNNRYGQLGTGDSDQRSLPTKVLDDVSGAYTGGAHTCAIKVDGSLYCWGNNQYGELGANVGSESLHPVRVMAACQ